MGQIPQEQQEEYLILEMEQEKVVVEKAQGKHGYDCLEAGERALLVVRPCCASLPANRKADRNIATTTKAPISPTSQMRPDTLDIPIPTPR